MAVHVKICGITNPADARAAVAAGADALGMVFAPSPRQVTLREAEAIRLSVPASMELVGVFVEEPLALVHDLIHMAGITAVQFHRDPQLHWSEPEWMRWQEMLRTRRIRVVSAIRAKNAAAMHSELSSRLAGADQILLDAYVPGLAGGTGKTFDWDLVETAKSYGVPVIVAGGLTADNVGEAVRRTQPWGVDVSSGVEAEPGRKDHEAVRRFVAAARAADCSETTPAW